MKQKYKFTSAILAMMLLAGCSASASSNLETPSKTSEPTEETTIDPTSMKTSIELDAEDTVETWDTATAINVTLNKTSASFTGTNISEANGTITISGPGTYVFSGDYEGRIVVNSAAKGTVRIVLNGVNISSSNNSAIEITESDKTILTLAKGTTNSVSDASEYTLNADEEPTAAIFSKDDLVINGSGSLTVQANYNDGITSKDDLYIVGGEIQVTAVDDGVIGKDTLYVFNAKLTVTSGGDALKATNDSEAGKGNILIDSGEFNLTAGDDGMQSISGVVIHDGSISILAGEGSENVVHTSNQMGGGFRGGMSQPTETTETEEQKCKGISTSGDVVIDGGTISIDASDDTIHSDNNVTINAGTIEVLSGDDGIHADNTLTINGGKVSVTRSYEGLEATYIVLNDGEIHVVSSDDGINSSNALTTGAMNSDGSTLTINGGTIVVEAGGDGLDMNGDGSMTGGTVTVYGPTSGADSAIDYNGTFTVDGGTMLAGCTQGMVEYPSQDSKDYAIIIGTSSGEITIQDASGNVLATYASSKTYSVLYFGSDQLKQGESYTILENGSELSTVTITDQVTYVNASATQGGMGGGMGGKPNMGTGGRGQAGI